MREGSEDEASSREDGAKDELLSPKKTATSIRVLTVLAYMLSVSLAAIMLSLYYVFLWDPKVPGSMRQVAQPADSLPWQPAFPEQTYPTTPPVMQYLTRLRYGPQYLTTRAQNN